MHEYNGEPRRARVHRAVKRRHERFSACGNHNCAFLCISTVLHVLSPAWQIFSSGHSTHFGCPRNTNFRPCQII